MSNWKIIVPEGTTNELLDPSFALDDPATEWTIAGDGAAPDVTRDTDYSYYGFSSALADIDDGTYVDAYQSITVTATSWTLSARVRRSAGGVPTSSHTRAYWNSAAADWDSITDIGDGWYLCVKTGTPTAGARNFGVRALEASLNFDAVQLENQSERTTYCDGEQEGCEWDGAQFSSSSTRSAQSRAGGFIQDFEDDFSFEVVDWMGWGVPPHLLNLDPYALMPGAQLNSVKVDVNVLTLTGYFDGSTMAAFHALRQALVEELAHDKYPETDAGWQPIRIRYLGADVPKEANVFYDGGLEGASMLNKAFTERIPVRFLMADPLWYELGESAAVLDSNDTITARYCAGRLRSTGQWDDLGLTADPDTSGNIYAICVASDGSVYFGGNFENWNGNAGDDTIIRFDPSDQSWNTLVGADEIDYGAGVFVHDIKEGPDGTIYICGDFENVGDANGDGIVSYDPSADSWTSLGAPAIDIAGGEYIYAMAFDSSGNLYVVGDFADVAGVANTANIAYWDGSSWNAVGGGITIAAGVPFAIAIDSQDNIVIGGNCTHATLDNYIFRYDGSSWDDLDSGTQSSAVRCLVFSDDDTLYLSGDFTNQGGDADCDYVCAWNGRQFIPMVGAGAPASVVYVLDIAPDGRVFAATSGWTMQSPAAWNGSAWELWDISISAYIVRSGSADPTIPSNYDLWMGDNGSASREIGGTATATNDGTAARHPVFKVSRSGGTTASLYTLRNEDTGKVLMFNYGLLDGETLTVDCRPGKRSITSSFFGERPDAILANSDFGSFALHSGDNQITCFVDVSGAPTVTAWLEYRDAYLGMD